VLLYCVFTSPLLGGGGFMRLLSFKSHSYILSPVRNDADDDDIREGCGEIPGEEIMENMRVLFLVVGRKTQAGIVKRWGNPPQYLV